MDKRRTRRLSHGLRALSCGLILAAHLFAPRSASADPSPSDRQTARNLLGGGRSLLDAGDARAALERFQGAHLLMNLPTTGFEVVKALEVLGRLVEARAMAYDVTQIPEKPGEAQAQKDVPPRPPPS
ncbi:hypothetical protein KEG38_23960 [Polyangium jinanense]|uniref:hypothetical protein n=1 Tax=Polyangium jinanense TaxID=2829994 RepID=UPI0023427912|nr:hypothetical protein [Polyangium jinanense]MDC3956937.1 hypothetical protein [Polyangium jinanense]